MIIVCVNKFKDENNNSDINELLITIGTTGVTKSTFCNWYIGCDLIYNDLERRVEVKTESEVKEKFKIGHTSSSMTILPKSEKIIDKKFICDLFGLKENRGFVTAIIGAMTT